MIQVYNCTCKLQYTVLQAAVQFVNSIFSADGSLILSANCFSLTVTVYCWFLCHHHYDTVGGVVEQRLERVNM